MTVRDNVFYKTEENSNFDRVAVEFTNSGTLFDSAFVDNKYYNIAGTNSGNATENDGVFFNFNSSDQQGCQFAYNKGHDLNAWYSGSPNTDDNLFKGNRAVGDPAKSVAPPRQRKSGKASDSGASIIPVGSDDNTGVITMTIDHGLDVTPSTAHIEVWFADATANDFSATGPMVQNVTSSTFDAVVNLESLSSQSGATIDIGWQADATPS